MMVLEMNVGARRANDKMWQRRIISRNDTVIEQQRKIIDLLEALLAEAKKDDRVKQGVQCE